MNSLFIYSKECEIICILWYSHDDSNLNFEPNEIMTIKLVFFSADPMFWLPLIYEIFVDFNFSWKDTISLWIPLSMHGQKPSQSDRREKPFSSCPLCISSEGKLGNYFVWRLTMTFCLCNISLHVAYQYSFPFIKYLNSNID